VAEGVGLVHLEEDANLICFHRGRRPSMRATVELDRVCERVNVGIQELLAGEVARRLQRDTCGGDGGTRMREGDQVVLLAGTLVLLFACVDAYDWSLLGRLSLHPHTLSH
jgi:hypothetical protein